MKIIKEHPHICAFLALLIIGLVVYAPWVSTTQCMNRGDVGNEYTPFFFYHAKAMFDDGEMPLWIHQISSGTPFFAVGDKPVLYPVTLLTLMIFDYGPAFNWNVLFHLIWAGMGMYFLVFYFLRRPPYAFISALVFMLNFHMFRKLLKFWGTSWLPWAMLCFYLAFNEKDRAKQIGYSILAALGLAAMFHAGSIEIALYSVVLVVFLSLYRLLSKDFSKRLKTIIIIGIISGAFFAGFIAVKLLPNFEFGNLTTRAQGISLEQAKGSYYYWTDLAIWNTDGGTVYAPKSLLLNLTKGCQRGACSAIGFIPSLLLLASLAFWRKKNVLFHWLILTFSIFMVTASFVFEFFFNYVPGFDKLQHAERFGIIYILAASVLVAYGTMKIADWAKKKFKHFDKHKTTIFAVLILLIIIDMVYVIGFAPRLAEWEFGDCDEYQKTPIMKYLASIYDKTDPFRIKVFESKGRGGVAQYVTIPLGLDIVDGQYGGLWITDYINQYLSIANNYPTKFWGNLNTRFVTMQEKRNITGMNYRGRFEDCPDCLQPFAAGPYLYELDNYLPRAFWTDQAILILGKDQNAKNAGFTLLANDDFDLKKQIIINGEHNTINQYSLDELSRYKAILLMPGSVDQNSNTLLQRYVGQGGLLVPNILDGQDVARVSDINQMLSVSNSSITSLKISSTPNTISIDTDGLQKGFLVIDERMHLFPGWKVYADDELILDSDKDSFDLTNLMLSGVYLEEPADDFKLVYAPNSFYLGKKITLFTILLAVLFGLYLGFRKWKRSQ